MHMLLTAITYLLSIPVLCTSQAHQAIMADQSNTDAYNPPANFNPTLADLLTVRSAGSIWYDYAREVEPVSIRLSDTSATSKSTLLVPVNKAILALHRKPHQGPEGDDVEITDEKTRVNVERWVSAHIIPVAPIELSSEETYPTLLDGHNVVFSRISETGKEWERYVVNQTIHIVDTVHASNGDIYFIDGVLGV